MRFLCEGYEEKEAGNSKELPMTGKAAQILASWK